ncbi:hypothetical protein KQI65_02685 [bacterium]|nr:hypothetical protein [bacterium]
MQHSILLIGHRATGKSTLAGALAARSGIRHVDLDTSIAETEGATAAELVAADEVAFRQMEIRTLSELLAGDEALIISAGGGLQQIPDGVYVIWVSRDGWDESALQERDRLRPDLTPDEEIAWMREMREPLYRRSAHVRLHLERGCSEEEATERLVLLVSWLEHAGGTPAARMSWILPRDEDDLSRAKADVRLFDLAGVEIRSDRFSSIPGLDVPYLASLRTEEEGFFARARDAAAFDCDTAFLQYLDLDGLEPRPLILSTHPSDVYKEYFDHLLSLPAWIARRWPEWEKHIVLKYAPRVKSWVELRYAYQLYKVLEAAGEQRITFLPQGKQWNWVRAMRLVNGNRSNYISTGCEEYSQLPPGIDYFLPHMQLPTARVFYGLLGDPVENSYGDIFHRALSLAADEGEAAYLKILLHETEIDNCLHLLPQFGFRGLSVTSPLKRAIVESNFVGCETDLDAGNTLAYIKGSFLLFDTDESGMLAALKEIENSDIAPGRTAIFGSGGVVPALQRALRARGWSQVDIYPARDGWKDAAEKEYTLVVDASGGQAVQKAAPHARAWLDLRYRDIARAPESADQLFSGMTFYKRQALEQRKLWGLNDIASHPLL